MCIGGGGGGAKRSRSLRRRATVPRWLLLGRRSVASAVRTACFVVRVTVVTRSRRYEIIRPVAARHLTKSYVTEAMLDMMNKMAELKFEAPLAQFEESEEWTKMMDDESPLQSTKHLNGHHHHHHHNHHSNNHRDQDNGEPTTVSDVEQLDNMLSSRALEPVNKSSSSSSSSVSSSSCAQCGANNNNVAVEVTADADNFGETFSGSLEDLVHTFDDKITRCFCDYEESVEKLAPVQIRTQEEIMNECQ